MLRVDHAADQIKHGLQTRREGLVKLYQQALSDTGWSRNGHGESRPVIALSEIETLLKYMTLTRASIPVARGRDLADLGVSEESALRLAQTARRFILTDLESELHLSAFELVDCYYTELMRSYMQRREESMLQEQERARAEVERIAGLGPYWQLAAAIARAGDDATDLDELVQAAADLIRQSLDVYFVGILLVDERREHAQLRAGTGAAGRELVDHAYRLGLEEHSPIASALRTAQPQVLPDPAQSNGHFTYPLLPDARSELILPLCARRSTIGVVTIQSQNEGAFSSLDLDALTLIAMQLAGAIHNWLQDAGTASRLAASASDQERLAEMQADLRAAREEINRLTAEGKKAKGASDGAQDTRLVPAQSWRQNPLSTVEPEEQSAPLPGRFLDPGSSPLPTLLYQVESDQFTPADDWPAAPLGARSSLASRIATTQYAIPLVLRDQLVGQIEVYDIDHPRRWSEEEIALANTVASQAALALENASLFQAAQQELAERKRAEEETLRRNAQLATLFEIGQALAHLQDPNEIARTVHTMLSRVMDTNSFYIAFHDAGRNELSFPILAIEGQIHQESTRAFGKGIPDYVIHTRTPLVVLQDVSGTLEELGISRRGRIAQSLVAVPLVAGDRALGAMVLQDFYRPNAYGPADVALLSAVGGEVASYLENARLFDQVRSSQNLLSNLMNSIPNPVFYKDTQGVFLGCNWAFVAYCGLQPEELVGKTVYDLPIPRDQAERFQEMDGALFRNPGTQIYESQISYADGSIHEVIFNNATFTQPDGSLGGLIGTIIDITDRKRAEAEVESSLKEKEIMLKEIHHRVKNNLQVVSSLLNLEAARVKDPDMVEILKQSQSRIRSMALIHEKLYRSKDLAHVDFEGYVRDLAAYLFRTYKSNVGPVDLIVDIHDVMVGIDRAIPCGLVINELISNSLKYAFPGNRSGRILVQLKPDARQMLVLKISDNGVGMPAHVDFRNTESLGMQLVNTLTTQLGGTIELDNRVGTTFTITFPADTLAG